MPTDSLLPPALSDADIQKFCELFEKEMGKKLSFPEARDYLCQLVSLAEIFNSISH